jgi:type IV secretory pathway protease TraF
VLGIVSAFPPHYAFLRQAARGFLDIIVSELKAIAAEATDWLPGERAILAAGDLVSAKKNLHQLPSEQLLPEELVWLRKW